MTGWINTTTRKTSPFTYICVDTHPVRRISIIAYADLGSQTGQALTDTSRRFHDRDRLGSVYCRGIEATELPPSRVETPIPFGRAIPRALTGINRYVSSRLDHRVVSEALFDRFTSRALSNDSSEVHFHYTPGYHRSMSQARGGDVMTVVRGSTELVEAANERQIAEARKFGVDATLSETQRRKGRIRRETLEAADRIVAISSFVKKSFVEAGIPAERIGVAPLGIDAASYPESEPEKNQKFTVTYVGSIRLLKGIQYLLEAWNQGDWGDDPGAELQLCGRVSPDIRPVLERASSDNVTLPGYVDPREYYRRSSVFVLPSISDGFGKSALEAMSCGLPVIVTENSGVVDVITDGDDGIIVPACDTEAIAEELRFLYENPSERARIGSNALETAREQTWEVHADTVLDIIDREI